MIKYYKVPIHSANKAKPSERSLHHITKPFLWLSPKGSFMTTTKVFLPRSDSSHPHGVPEPSLGNSAGVPLISEGEDAGTFHSLCPHLVSPSPALRIASPRAQLSSSPPARQEAVVRDGAKGKAQSPPSARLRGCNGDAPGSCPSPPPIVWTEGSRAR